MRSSQKRLFDPLGMKDTTFYPTEAQRARRVTAYTKNKDTGALEPVPPRPEYEIAHAAAGQWWALFDCQ